MDLLAYVLLFVAMVVVFIFLHRLMTWLAEDNEMHILSVESRMYDIWDRQIKHINRLEKQINRLEAWAEFQMDQGPPENKDFESVQWAEQGEHHDFD